MSYLHTLTAIIGFVSLSIAASYAVLTFIAFLVWQLRKPPRTSVQLPPVTLLKALCGAEPGLYEH